MKRTNNILIVALAGIALSLFADSAQAQYNPTGDDGVTASPKVRAQLDDRNARLSTPSATVVAMACPKCNDTLVARNNTNPKGSGARTLMGQTTEIVSQHLCAGCAVDWTIVGQGKAKQSVATHKCTSCGAELATCCNKAGNVATKGMQKQVEIAPLK